MFPIILKNHWNYCFETYKTSLFKVKKSTSIRSTTFSKNYQLGIVWIILYVFLSLYYLFNCFLSLLFRGSSRNKDAVNELAWYSNYWNFSEWLFSSKTRSIFTCQKGEYIAPRCMVAYQRWYSPNFLSLFIIWPQVLGVVPINFRISRWYAST